MNLTVQTWWIYNGLAPNVTANHQWPRYSTSPRRRSYHSTVSAIATGHPARSRVSVSIGDVYPRPFARALNHRLTYLDLNRGASAFLRRAPWPRQELYLLLHKSVLEESLQRRRRYYGRGHLWRRSILKKKSRSSRRNFTLVPDYHCTRAFPALPDTQDGYMPRLSYACATGQMDRLDADSRNDAQLEQQKRHCFAAVRLALNRVSGLATRSRTTFIATNTPVPLGGSVVGSALHRTHPRASSHCNCSVRDRTHLVHNLRDLPQPGLHHSFTPIRHVQLQSRAAGVNSAISLPA